jgi:hypothetical protein
MFTHFYDVRIGEAYSFWRGQVFISGIKTGDENINPYQLVWLV